MRMLKFNHKAMRRTNISDVPFSRLPVVPDNLLAFGWELAFPRAVPFGFVLRPGITTPHSPVRPVSDFMRAAFGNDLATTTGTRPPPFGIGLKTLTACKRKFHIARPPLESEEIG